MDEQGLQRRPPKAGGWYWLANDVTDQAAKLGTTELAVLVGLSRFADNRSGLSIVSQSTLAEWLSVNVRTVRRAIKSLTCAGIVTSEIRSEGHQKLANGYRVQCATSGTLDRSQEDTSVPLEASPRGQKRPSKRTKTTVQEDTSVLARKQDSFIKTLLQEEPPISPKGDCTNGKCPSGLLDLIDGWNALPAGIGPRVRRDPPPTNLFEVWKRTKRDPDLREAVADVSRLMDAIRKSTYCHGKGWFRLPWLLTQEKGSREWFAVRVLDGCYSEKSTNGHGSNNGNSGGRYGDRRPCGTMDKTTRE